MATYNAKTNAFSTTKSDYGLKRLGAYHMIGNDDYEPQRTNNFELHIYGLGDLTSVAGNETYNAASVEDALTLSAVSFGGINTEISPIEVPYGNTKVKYAGTPSISDSDIVYNDYLGQDTERILAAWHGLVFNPRTEKIGKASEYKKPALLIETAPDGTTSRVWQLKGCWPSKISYGGYDYSRSEVRQITVTFTYDIAIPLDGETDATANTAYGGYGITKIN